MADKRKKPASRDAQNLTVPTSRQAKQKPAEHLLSTSEFRIILWLLLAVLALVLLGLYLWHQTLSTPAAQTDTADTARPAPADNHEPESRNAVADIETMDTMSTSDTLPAISADLDSTILDSLDTEYTAIENELQREP